MGEGPISHNTVTYATLILAFVFWKFDYCTNTNISFASEKFQMNNINVLRHVTFLVPF